MALAKRHIMAGNNKNAALVVRNYQLQKDTLKHWSLNHFRYSFAITYTYNNSFQHVSPMRISYETHFFPHTSRPLTFNLYSTDHLAWGEVTDAYFLRIGNFVKLAPWLGRLDIAGAQHESISNSRSAAPWVVGVWYNNGIGKAASYYTILTLLRRLFITVQRKLHT